jgi:hypothetical protein
VIPDRKQAVSTVQKPQNPGVTDAPAATDVIQDGSFEDGSPNAFWDEFSSGFGTPLCNPTCGVAGARTGSWWVWFGGAGSNTAEDGYVSQAVTITSGIAKLKFWMFMNGGGTGNFTVTLDSTVIFTVNQTMSPTYNTDYTLVTLDVSSFANGLQHVLKFAESDPATPGGFNVFVDDVSLSIIDCTATNLPWLTVSPTSGTTGPRSSSVINLIFNSAQLAGTYTGKLCITSNDPTVDVIEVPVTLKSIGYYLPVFYR